MNTHRFPNAIFVKNKIDFKFAIGFIVIEKTFASFLGYPICVRLTQKVETCMDYRSHVAQTLLFPKRPK